MGHRKKPPPAPAQAAMVPVPQVLLEAVRATHPITYDWTDTQVVTGCLALAVKLAAVQPVPAMEGTQHEC
jgi:hypothetical protein